MKKDLTKFLKKFLNNLYQLFFYDKGLPGLLAEYFNMPERESLWILKNSERINAGFWMIRNPKTDMQKQEFYSTTPFYIFSLLWWHQSRYQKLFRNEILELCHGKVLDYGGGTGDICIKLAVRGIQADYADIPGKTFDFAKWIFKKKCLEIKMFSLPEEKIPSNYDTIICIDVLEHVPNPKKVLHDISGILNPGGSLIVTNLKLDEIVDGQPMHEKVNIDEKFLKSLGFVKTQNIWLIKKIKY